MHKKTTTVLQFGKTPVRPAEPAKKTKKDPSAELALAFGVMVAAVFFVSSLTEGSLTGDAMRVESVLNDAAVPVMSTGVEETSETEEYNPEEIREILRKNVRDASGEALGYMGGKWNLWEYLGDIMAEMLIGE